MNRPIHFEIHSTDPEIAGAFFAKVFGWKLHKWEGPMEYWLVCTSPDGKQGGESREHAGIDGGMMRSRDGQPRTVNTVEVKNVDEHMKKVEAAGGRVVVPKMGIQGVGYVAYCTDPTGALFGVMHADPNAK